MTIDRRKFVTVTGSALSAAILASCDSRGPRSAERLLRYAERKNEALERALFRHTSMDAPLAGARLAGNALPSYFISKTVPVWDESVRGAWTLDVGGLVDKPMRLTLQNLLDLPRTHTRVNHYCVEGWTAVEQWTGVRLADLAKLVGVHRDAQYVDFESFDDGFHESWDIESAMHPQTVVAYGLDGHMLGPAHGAPVRVFSPIKLGYKNTKYLTRIMFLPNRTGGYWSDMGYEWYGGV
ncbi:MAG: molybdopterin-dependent oxidoreductase [Gemmatimonadaceae bacterium]|nr:molybdopterin-dependent oxidoreductase [Gemmatimonadaceae bacterium]